MLQPCEQRFPLVQWRIQTFRWGGEGGGVIQILRLGEGGAGSKKFFWALHFGLEIRGAAPPDPSPGSATVVMAFSFTTAFAELQPN